MSYIVEYSVPVFLHVEDEDAKTEDEAAAYADLQIDNQNVLTVISDALGAKTSFEVGDNFHAEDATVNEV